MKKALSSILFVIFLSIFLYSGYRLYLIFSEYHRGTSSYKETASQYVSQSPLPPQKEGEQETGEEEDPLTPPGLCPIQVDFGALRAENPDIKGWLYMEDSVINYPVLQGATNDTYLRHLPDGSYNTAGSLFIDSACRADLTDLTTIIYGHNMHNGSMFAVLESYKKQSFYDSHPIMWYLTPEGTFRLDILAGFIESAEHPLYSLYETKEELDGFLDYALPRSDFRTRCQETHPERIFILSTCDYAYEDARYILIAEPVPQEEQGISPGD